MLKEVRKLSRKDQSVLRIGYLNCYGGNEFQNALSQFSLEYPDTRIEIINGNHETLYHALVNDEVDLVLNDQRRAFAQDYINYELVEATCYIEISHHNPLSHLDKIEAADLKNTPCILVASTDQQTNEADYYRDIIGFKSGFIFTDSLQKARLLVVSGQGFLPVEGIRDDVYYDSSLARVPLFRNNEPVLRKYCAFWKKENHNEAIQAFAAILNRQFC